MKNKFESISNKMFTPFELNKINNLNAVCGGFKIKTDAAACTYAAGNTYDTYDAVTTEVSDEGCE